MVPCHTVADAVQMLEAQLEEANQDIAAAELGETVARKELEDAKLRFSQATNLATELKCCKEKAARLAKEREEALAALASLRIKLESEIRAKEAGTTHQITDVTAQMKCPICVDFLLSPYTLACGCSFCEVCLHTSIRGSLSCPVCRAAIFRLPTRSKALSFVSSAIAAQVYPSTLCVIPLECAGHCHTPRHCHTLRHGHPDECV